MNLRISNLLAIAAFVYGSFVSVPTRAQNAYITNLGTNGGGKTVSVIDTTTNAVTATITVGNGPAGVAVTPDGSKVYVANSASNSVSVIVTATKAVSTITDPSFAQPTGVAVNADGSKVYVANSASNTVSVIATATNAVSTVTVGATPLGVVVTPDGSKVYVVNLGDGTVSVIDTATNAVSTITDPSFSAPQGVAVSPDGSKAYVSNSGSNTVSVIDTATNVVTTISDTSFNQPVAFGVFTPWKYSRRSFLAPRATACMAAPLRAILPSPPVKTAPSSAAARSPATSP